MKTKHNYMTMIELVIAMSVFILLMSFLIQFLVDAHKVSDRQRSRNLQYEDQRMLLDLVSQDLNGIVASNDENRFIDNWFRDADFSGVTIGSDSFDFKGIWISSSGIGTDSSNDTSKVIEVAYALNTTNSTIVRFVTTSNNVSGNPNSSWDFMNSKWQVWGDPTTETWEDSSVIMENVLDFKIDAYDTDGNPINSAGTDSEYLYPAIIKISAQTIGASGLSGSVNDSSKARNFSKIVYLYRGGLQ
ncbi:MAG: type II secretion system protein [Lentisphaeria bacterium]|nr:type II secretion system GspH family protein [Lentisphaeria bacterium]NQZ69897.1 type II secretion system protein [Lentisphaeria bacterium]